MVTGVYRFYRLFICKYDKLLSDNRKIIMHIYLHLFQAPARLKVLCKYTHPKFLCTFMNTHAHPHTDTHRWWKKWENIRTQLKHVPHLERGMWNVDLEDNSHCCGDRRHFSHHTPNCSMVHSITLKDSELFLESSTTGKDRICI